MIFIQWSSEFNYIVFIKLVYGSVLLRIVINLEGSSLLITGTSVLNITKTQIYRKIKKRYEGGSLWIRRKKSAEPTSHVFPK